MKGLKVSVIIVAAGSGRRFGYERNKLFFPLCGKPVLTHTLQHVFAAACVSEVVIVVAERDRRDIEDMVAGLHPSVPVVLLWEERNGKILFIMASWQQMSQPTSLWSTMGHAPWSVRSGLIMPCRLWKKQM